jgi:hypothetical protein
MSGTKKKTNKLEMNLYSGHGHAQICITREVYGTKNKMFDRKMMIVGGKR